MQQRTIPLDTAAPAAPPALDHAVGRLVESLLANAVLSNNANACVEAADRAAAAYMAAIGHAPKEAVAAAHSASPLDGTAAAAFLLGRLSAMRSVSARIAARILDELLPAAVKEHPALVAAPEIGIGESPARPDLMRGSGAADWTECRGGVLHGPADAAETAASIPVADEDRKRAALLDALEENADVALAIGRGLTDRREIAAATCRSPSSASAAIGALCVAGAVDFQPGVTVVHTLSAQAREVVRRARPAVGVDVLPGDLAAAVLLVRNLSATRPGDALESRQAALFGVLRSGDALPDDQWSLSMDQSCRLVLRGPDGLPTYSMTATADGYVVRVHLDGRTGGARDGLVLSTVDGPLKAVMESLSR